jgi:hypothetical protein
MATKRCCIEGSTLRRAFFLFVFLTLLLERSTAKTHLSVPHATQSSSQLSFGVPRGGGGVTSLDPSSTTSTVFHVLARALADKVDDTDQTQIATALSKLGSAQQAFKGLDGAAHEAYQRTHSGDDIMDASVAGRAQRSADRLGATAEALLACELIELLLQSSSPGQELVEESEGSLNNRQVVLNNTRIPFGTSGTYLSVLVLYEPSYNGGAGLDHGSILHLSDTKKNLPQKQRSTTNRPPRGRLLVILGDSVSSDLGATIKLLDQKPRRVKLSSGLVTNEVVSVQPTLYKTAGQLLQTLEPLLRSSLYNTTAIHIVGRSLAGGVASLAATMLDGSLPLPQVKSKEKTKSPSPKKKKTGKKTSTHNDKEDAPLPSENGIATTTLQKSLDEPSADSGSDETDATAVEDDVLPLEPLNGLGRARSSALSLGAPPCLSSNVVAAYCTSFLYGDDIVCRTTSDSMARLVERVQKKLQGGMIGRNLGWMTDTLSLAVYNLKTHAHGSEGEEIKLAVPGRAYLLRPRRLGGICSIHEVGTLKKGGREAFRAGLLWQLNDILLSKSLWKHHQLESYIHGLDRVQLRGIGEEDAAY